MGVSTATATNDCNLATWEQRKPRTYFSYHAAQWTAANYAGQATLSGNTYTVTGTAAASDKLVQHFLAPGAPANASHGASLTCSIAATTGVATVASHGLVNGDIITFGTNGGAVPSPLVAGQYYYALVIDANTFNVSATRGGSAVTTAASGTGVTIGFWMSLSIDGGSTYYPMVMIYVPYASNPFTGYTAPAARQTVTVVFDQSMNMFVLSNGVNNVGQLTGYPPEVVADIVAEIGSSAIHIVAPCTSARRRAPALTA